MVEVGKVYYFVIHAYHHVIARVKAITGKKEADLEHVAWIYRCARDWTEFFADGVGEDTAWHRFPDAHGASWIAAFEWKHPNPAEEK